MIRITTLDGEGPAELRLRVEGRITRETSAALDAACRERDPAHRHVALDLAGVEFVDAAGASLLAALTRQGVGLAGCSDFVRTSIAGAGPAGGPGGAHPGTSATSELTLVARLRAGDEQAHEELVRCYGARMLATARRMVGSEAEARDVVQEALLSAFRAMARFEGEARLSTWLHRITINAALMRLRTRRRRREESIDDLLPRFDDEGWWPEGPTSAPAAEEALEQAEAHARVRRAIAELPETYRTILMLRDIEDLDPQETATLLGIGTNAVKSRLHRARQALKTLLERDGVLPGAPPSRAAGVPALGAADDDRRAMAG